MAQHLICSLIMYNLKEKMVTQHFTLYVQNIFFRRHLLHIMYLVRSEKITHKFFKHNFSSIGALSLNTVNF